MKCEAEASHDFKKVPWYCGKLWRGVKICRKCLREEFVKEVP
jgi:hypothetical protein